jgi:hypothetical protein
MRIPFAEIQTETPGQAVAPPQLDVYRMGAESAAGAGAMAETVGTAAQQVGQAVDKIDQARQAVQVSNAATDTAGQLADARLQLEKDPDVAGRLAKFQAKADEIKQKQLGNFVGRAAGEYTLRFNQLYKPMEIEVRGDAWREEIQQHRVELSDSLERMANNAIFAKTPLERVAIQGEAEKQIEQAVNTGYLHANQASQLKHAFLGKVDASLAAEQVRLNPGLAIQQLGNPNMYPNMDASTRVQLRAQAQARSESLGAQARAELRYDTQEMMQDIQRSAAGGPPVDPNQVKALVQRWGGAKSGEGIRLQKTYDFYTQVNADAAGKSIPELQTQIGQLQGAPTAANLDAAKAAMALDAQEEALYRRHLANVVGPGGITQPSGQRSTLEIMTREIDGRTYLIPTVWDGKELQPEAATQRAMQAGLDQFPSYATQREADARYQAMHAFMAQDIRQPTAQDIHAARILSTALQHKVTARDADPAAYAAATYPTIGEQLATAERMGASNDAMQQAQAQNLRNTGWAALLEAERREGVPDYKLALLTKPQAESLKAQLTTSAPQARADAVTNLRNTFGDNWALVNRQLWQGKPGPPDIAVLAALPTTEDANLVKGQLVEAFNVTDHQATQQLGGQRMKAIGDETRNTTAEMAATMAQAPDGPRFISTWQTAVDRLARLYAIRGEKNDADAARRAANDLFYSHWTVADAVNGVSVRVPNVQGVPVVETSDVAGAQRAILALLPQMDLLDPGGLPGTTPAQRKQMLVNNARSLGYWMTTPDETGMVLFAGPGQAVRFADGAPVTVPFDSARAMAQQGAAARARRIEESTRSMGEEVAPQQEPGAVRLPPKFIQRYLTQPPPAGMP